MNLPTTHVAYTIATEIVVNNTTYETIGYFSWDNSRYSNYTNGALVYEVVITDRDLDIRLRDITNNSTIVEDNGVSSSGFRNTSGFTNPSSDARIAIQVRKSAIGGISPTLYRIQLEWIQ